jgi:predicted P-loop ATPase
VVIDVASFPNAVLDLLGCAQFASLTGDTFRGSMTLNAEAVTDSTMLRIRLDLYSITGLNHRPQDVEAAVTHVASNVRGINPVTDYLKGLKWDGVPRIQDWLGHSFGIQTTRQEQAYQRKFFIAMVARILSPGCKVDDCLSIIGPPGIKKSSLFRALVPSPDLFTDSHMDLENKDTFMKLRRVVLVEIGEERDFLRGGQEATKRFLSTQEDFYRAPYGRAVESHARHCVFVITTNARRPTIFMDFTSEGRRYWPISLYDRPGLHDAALDWVLKHRQQLWAEAVTAYQQGELYYFDSPHDKAAHQEHFRQYLETDPTDLQVEAALDALNKDRVTLGEVLERMRVPISEYSKNTRRVSAALERVGWEVVSYSSTKHRSKVAVWGNKHASPAAPAHSLPKWRGVPTDDDGVPM